MKLYTYTRSSASYRVRIALHWKGLDFESGFVDLRRGEQRGPAYLAVNPQGLVPTLVDGETVLGQSLAILEYLEERHPEPPLLPAGAAARARVRQLALLVACEIHPLQNLGVLVRLERDFGLEPGEREGWARGVIERGLASLEVLLAGHPATGRFCHGDAPSFADLCLVPQVYNARRYGCELAGVPTVRAIYGRCMEEEAFARAAPEAQADATGS